MLWSMIDHENRNTKINDIINKFSYCGITREFEELVDLLEFDKDSFVSDVT